MSFQNNPSPINSLSITICHPVPPDPLYSSPNSLPRSLHLLLIHFLLVIPERLQNSLSLLEILIVAHLQAIRKHEVVHALPAGVFEPSGVGLVCWVGADGGGFVICIGGCIRA